MKPLLRHVHQFTFIIVNTFASAQGLAACLLNDAATQKGEAVATINDDDVVAVTFLGDVMVCLIPIATTS